jgi:hypothetical protein
VIECEPTASVDLVRAATPPLNVNDPMVVVPPRNTTLPVGASGPDEVTVALKVTACPYADGFKLETSAVAVAYISTTWVTFPVLGSNVPSPSYVALMMCFFAVRGRLGTSPRRRSWCPCRFLWSGHRR